LGYRHVVVKLVVSMYEIAKLSFRRCVCADSGLVREIELLPYEIVDW